MTSRALLISSLFTPFVAAFTPVFSAPSQCGELKMTWASFDWEVSVPEIFMSLVPVDHSVDPYSVVVPCGQGVSGELTIPNLPFPGGTQFYADAFGPGMQRRQVSSVFSVASSSDTSCLSHYAKRQVNVIGTGIVDAAAPIPSNVPVSSSAAVPIIEIGPSELPLNEADLNASQTAVNNGLNNVAPAPSNSLPIVEIGTSQISADGSLPTLSLVNNVAPAPSDAPPINEVGTSFIPVDGSSTTLDAFAPGETDNLNLGDQFATETTTSCTETETGIEFATATSDFESPQITDIYDGFNNQFNGTDFTDERGVVHFGSFQDLVDAANAIFKAWNPTFGGFSQDSESFDSEDRTYGYPPPTYTRSSEDSEYTSDNSEFSSDNSEYSY